MTASIEKHILQSPSPTASEKSIAASESSGNGKRLDITTESRPSRLPKFSSDKPSVIKKRTLAITDKKVNPEFFQKLSTKNNEDWEIEVAVPPKCPSPVIGPPEADIKKVDGNRVVMQALTERSLPGKEPLFQGMDRFNPDDVVGSDNEGEEFQKDVSQNGGTSHRNEKRQEFGKSPFQVERVLVTPFVKKDATHLMDLESFQTQLVQLEQQQSNLLQIVQEFIVSSQDNMFALQARVRQLERIVDEMASNSNFASENSINYDASGIRPFSGKLVGSDHRNSCSRAVHVGHPVSDTELASEDMGGRTAGVRNRGCRVLLDLVSDEWNHYNVNSRLKSFDNGLHSQQRSNSAACDSSRVDSETLGAEQDVMRRLWDKSGLGRRGEGPSARSVWQAAKDEATLEAIRVAGEDVEISEAEALSNGISRLDSGSGRTVRNIEGQLKGQLNLWGLVLHCVHTGDMEAAYCEALCTEDTLMLVRLMSKTGPVLDQLSVSTASEVLHAVAQLLQQQSYVDLSVSWIRQVAHMIINDGADCLEVPEDVKKGLLLGLQELIGRGMLEESSGTSVEQLLQVLMDGWSFSSKLFGN